MDKPILIAELICLTMICQASCEPLKKCQTKESGKKVDCSFKWTKSIQDIFRNETSKRWLPTKVQTPSQVESLDISGNRYISGECNELTHLLQFSAKNVTIAKGSASTFKTCLGKLKMLEELDLSNTSTLGSKLEGFEWSKRLIKITLTKMKLREILGLDKLDHLQELDLSDNNLTSFPKLNKTAPIVLLHLRNNNVTNITVEDIASFCEMSSFSVPEQMNDAKNYHYCAPLQEWTKKYSTDTFETLSCERPKDGQTNKVTFSEEAIKARTTCISALPGTGIWDILFFAVFFSILFPLLYYANEAYNNYQTKKVEPTHAPVKRRRRRKTTTTAPLVESDYEDAPLEHEQEES